MSYDCDARILFESSRHAKAEGLRWGVGLSKTVKEVALLGPVSQLACLSCCSILTERASGGCAVGGRLLSTPSRLFLHTGQVSCCDRERIKNIFICRRKNVRGITAVHFFFCKRFLCCRGSPRFQDEWCTVKTSVTNLREQFKPISPLTTSTPPSLPAPAKALYSHCGSNGGRVASWQIPLMNTPPYKLDTPVCSLREKKKQEKQKNRKQGYECVHGEERERE